MTPTTSTTIAERLASYAAPAATIAGSLWILHYALQLGYGLATGKVLFNATGTAPHRFDLLAFFGAYLATGGALLGLALRLSGREKALGVSGAFFAFIGALAGLIGMLAATVNMAALDLLARLAGPSILAHFLAALLLGIAYLRPQPRLPDPERRAGLFILLFALLTVPLAMAFGMLESTVPSYTVTELHFTVSGALWLATATALRASDREKRENIRAA